MQAAFEYAWPDLFQFHFLFVTFMQEEITLFVTPGACHIYIFIFIYMHVYKYIHMIYERIHTTFAWIHVYYTIILYIYIYYTCICMHIYIYIFKGSLDEKLPSYEVLNMLRE